MVSLRSQSCQPNSPENVQPAERGLTFGLEHIIRTRVQDFIITVNREVREVFDRAVSRIGDDVDEIVGQVDGETHLIIGCELVVLAEGIQTMVNTPSAFPPGIQRSDDDNGSVVWPSMLPMLNWPVCS